MKLLVGLILLALGVIAALILALFGAEAFWGAIAAWILALVVGGTPLSVLVIKYRRRYGEWPWEG